MEKHVGIKSTFFILILLTFIVGGFILMQKSSQKLNEKTDNEVEEKEEVKDIRLDSTKEYIYYSDAEEIEHELDIIYKKVNLNFKDFNNIASTLNNENKTMKELLKYDDIEQDKIIEAKYKVYNTYYFEDYISLVVDYFTYDVENLISYLSSKVYVFNKNTGALISDEELLKAYELTKDDIISKVKKHLENEDVGKKEEDLDIDLTLKGLDDLKIYVDKIGRLSLSILVKSDQKDYNEVILLS